MKKIPWNKDDKLSKTHVERMLATRKITNTKKSLELKSRTCNLHPTHIPYTNKIGNPVWFKDLKATEKFVCGLCHYHQVKKLKFLSKDEQYQAQSELMKKNNPMKNKKIAQKLAKMKKGVKIGPVHSDQFKEKQRIRFIQNNPSKNGIPQEQRTKISKTRLEKFQKGELKPSVQKKGEDNPRYGIPRSESVRKAIGIANKGKVLSEKTKSKLREARKNQKNIGQRGTIPEFQAQIILEELGIEFKTDVPGIIGRPDFLVEKKYVIFVDGVFTHACPRPFQHRGQMCQGYLPEQKIIGKKIAKMIWDYDAKVRDTLINEGFHVLRIWEDEIRYNPELIIDKIQSFLKK